MIDQQPVPGPSSQAAAGPIHTRDWVWGVIVVVGGTILVIGTLIWILVGSASCGTRPASGYEDGGGAVYSCQSVRGRPLLADLPSEPAAVDHPVAHMPRHLPGRGNRG